jgi:hypothetical protein
MSYLTISLDLIAGLLVGIHLWVPQKYRQNWDKFLLKSLAPDDNPVDEITFKGSILFTTLMVIGVMVWGYFIDINKGNIAAEELTKTSLLVIAGIPIAVILLVATIVLYQKIELIHRIPFVSVIAAIAVIVGILALLLTEVASQSFDIMILGFVFSLVFMTLLVQVLPMGRKFFTFEGGVLARLGIAIFVVSKIIQIANLH